MTNEEQIKQFAITTTGWKTSKDGAMLHLQAIAAFWLVEDEQLQSKIIHQQYYAVKLPSTASEEEQNGARDFAIERLIDELDLQFKVGSWCNVQMSVKAIEPFTQPILGG
jgi:hypothetical protein